MATVTCVGCSEMFKMIGFFFLFWFTCSIVVVASLCVITFICLFHL